MEKGLYKDLIEFDFSQNAVLCSQLEWSGSVPRKDYPYMLVLEDGSSRGTIGGGVMEHNVIESAKKILSTGTTLFSEFDLGHSDADGEGGICGGRTKILIEPFTPDIQKFWKSLNMVRSGKDELVLVTEVLEGEKITCSRVFISEEFLFSDFGGDTIAKIKSSKPKNKAISFHLDDGFYLIQPIIAQPLLHIFGAGHVGTSVAQLASFIDLDVAVYDDRSDLANFNRIPNAKTILTEPFAALEKKIVINPQDFVLVATRGHKHDLEMVRWMIRQDFKYLGLVSSRRKWKLLVDKLKEEGVTDKQIRRVHAPVGIHIHSETVPEIAVSIIAEIILESRNPKLSNPNI
ncbi:MAG: XdhC family protein [Calditrichaeota bacterium]|nr:XdhC family protein [Calditrichota bacterium]